MTRKSGVLRGLDGIDLDLRAELRQIQEAADRLERAQTVRARLERITSDVLWLVSREICECRDAGLTWRDIGDLLGVTLQRAEQLSQIYRTNTEEKT